MTNRKSNVGLMIIGILSIASVVFIVSMKNKPTTTKTYYDEMFPNSKISMGLPAIYGIPAYNKAAAEAHDGKYKEFFLTAIDIGLQKNGHLKHSAEGWTLTCVPDGIVRYKISDDGRKFLVAGMQEGNAVIHISHKKADEAFDFKVNVIDWKTFCYRAGLSDGENPYGK